MEEILKLDPIMKVGGSVDLPGSKSISNRALLLAALSEGTTESNNLLVAEKTEMMIGALETLGVKLEVSNDGTEVKVEGCGGNFPVKKADLFLGNAGTAMRPLSSSLAFSGGEYVLDGVARMRQRPIAHLVEALNSSAAASLILESRDSRRSRLNRQPGLIATLSMFAAMFPVSLFPVC